MWVGSNGRGVSRIEFGEGVSFFVKDDEGYSVSPITSRIRGSPTRHGQETTCCSP